MFRVYDKRQCLEVDGRKEYEEVTVYHIKEQLTRIYFLIYNHSMKTWEYVDADNFEEINYGCDPAYYGV